MPKAPNSGLDLEILPNESIDSVLISMCWTYTDKHIDVIITILLLPNFLKRSSSHFLNQVKKAHSIGKC